MSTNFHLTARLLPSDTAAGKVLEAQHMSGTSQCLQVLGRSLAWQLRSGIVFILALSVLSLHHSAFQVTGIAVCNEPSRLIPADILARFYDEACWSSPTSRWNMK